MDGEFLTIIEQRFDLNLALIRKKFLYDGKRRS
jgi:hypothetical protein